jgi:multiple sugar transport system substrate-binding protein
MAKLCAVLIGVMFLSGCFEKKEVVEFWTQETEPERMEIQKQLAEMFSESYNVKVKIVPVDENVLAERIAAAKAAGRLPDVVQVGLSLMVKLTEEGVLDPEPATKVIDSLGRESFYSGALRLCEYRDGLYSAVPIDGWAQGVWFRKDWFSEKNLSEPSTLKSILDAASCLHNPEEKVYGIVIGTDPEQLYTHQVFEHIALAFGVKNIHSPKMKDVFEYYSELARFCPPGHNYWRQARQYYLTGRCGMIFYSPYIIDDIAGLVKEHRPEIPDLAEKTGFCPVISGASYGEIYALGITEGAEKKVEEWVRFLLTTGYIDWLFMSPGGKTPVRKGVIDEWRKHQFFSEYEEQMAERIASGMERIERWGFVEERDPKISDVYALKLFPQAVGKLLDGEPTESVIEWLYDEIEMM